jgi:hypothetical protein
MKMVVVTEQGQIVAMAHGSLAQHARAAAPTAGSGGLYALPGQKMHEVDVPDDLEAQEDGHKLHAQVSRYFKP